MLKKCITEFLIENSFIHLLAPFPSEPWPELISFDESDHDVNQIGCRPRIESFLDDLSQKSFVWHHYSSEMNTNIIIKFGVK